RGRPDQGGRRLVRGGRKGDPSLAKSDAPTPPGEIGFRRGLRRRAALARRGQRLHCAGEEYVRQLDEVVEAVGRSLPLLLGASGHLRLLIGAGGAARLTLARPAGLIRIEKE